ERLPTARVRGSTRAVPGHASVPQSGLPHGGEALDGGNGTGTRRDGLGGDRDLRAAGAARRLHVFRGRIAVRGAAGADRAGGPCDRHRLPAARSAAVRGAAALARENAALHANAVEGVSVTARLRR